MKSTPDGLAAPRNLTHTSSLLSPAAPAAALDPSPAPLAPPGDSAMAPSIAPIAPPSAGLSDVALAGGGVGGDGDGGGVSLRTILQNFLNHVETLEGEVQAGETTYEKEFLQLKAFSDSLKHLTEFSCAQGEIEVNRKKNRYKDILPFDQTRVLLSDYPGVPGSDYINANFIKGASGSNAYIAAQGPLPHTVNDFWRMVVETEVQVVVMACNETEAGKHKCERYWNEPDECEAERQFGKFFVQTLKMREICPDFLVRTMRLRWTSERGNPEERTVCQFHYSAWPDHGIPTQVKPLLEMVRLIRDCQASETLPVLIHCSAGCGRTGTICAIDFIWGLLRTGKLTSDFSLFELVRDMRKQRVAMVQTVDQYILVHRAVRELFLEQLRVIDSHPYENVDDEGNPLGRSSDDEAPDYEAIFVKRDSSGDDIDQILNQRVSQPRTVMGTSMLGREKNRESDSEQTPPVPPPKQRNIDSTPIDSRRIDVSDDPNSICLYKSVEELTKPPTPKNDLLEPAKPPDDSKDAAAQRFKKGHLRLAKTDDGGWRLQELENHEDKRPISSSMTNIAISEKKPESLRSKKKKNNGDEGSDKSGKIMRRPSIKKLRAFFQKDKTDKEAHLQSADHYSGSGEDSPSSCSDPELVSALAKLPKFYPESVSVPASIESSPSLASKSVPSSLDRRVIKSKSPEYANLNKEVDNNNKLSWDRSKQVALMKPSSSSEKLAINSNHKESKPLLPIKRSKSMKTLTKPFSVLPYFQTDHRNKKLSLPHQRAVSPPKNLNLQTSLTEASHQRPPLPASVSEYNHYHSLQSTIQAVKDSNGSSKKAKLTVQGSPPPTKPKRYPLGAVSDQTDQSSTDNANAQRSPERNNFFERQLAKIHAKMTAEEDPNVPLELRRTLPMLVKSSENFDEKSKQMLQECQEYLAKSLEVTPNPSSLFRNQSAENSPITTLQKASPASSYLFSSHSSPSNSFNKYNPKMSTPPGTIQKSVSSVTGAIQKNFCSPSVRSITEPADKRSAPLSPFSLMTTAPTDESRALPKQCPWDLKESLNIKIGSPPKSNDNSGSAASSIVVAEAQRKIGDASSVRLNPRERRNSFREAVDKSQNIAVGHRHSVPQKHHPPPQSYETIWLGQNPNSDSGLDGNIAEPAYVNAYIHHTNQKAEPQMPPNISSKDDAQLMFSRNYRHKEREDRPERNSTYENVVSSRAVLDNGYEPVSFNAGLGLMRNMPNEKMSPQRSPHEEERGGGKNVLHPSPQRPLTLVSSSSFSTTGSGGGLPMTYSSPLHNNQSQLQSVGLVAEVLSTLSHPGIRSNPSPQREAGVLVKQNSSSSLCSSSRGNSQNKGAPPPYKEPPQPSKLKSFPLSAPNLQTPQFQAQPQQNDPGGDGHWRKPDLPAKEGPSNSSSIYANVNKSYQRGRHSRGTARNSTKDDTVLSNKTVRQRRSASQAPPTNRLSMGDFTYQNYQPQSLQARGGKGDRDDAIYSTISGDTATLSASSSPAHQINSKPIGRTLVGVLSGAAANIRSKFTNLSHHQTHGIDSSSSVYQVNQSPSRMKGNGPRASGGTSGAGLAHLTQTPQAVRDYEDIRRGHNGGLEQSPQSIPITVPGAEGLSRNGNYDFPRRPDVRPLGPREVPNHFSVTKQAFL
ncbi:uncharacterized protein LOC131886245 isoform X2 [Tigriopus californicus]|uniref:uncharacterized protein LOC131886245 isoform X2 n=1 Tax=Tigriopus californicus TaxID=6832 RepID=UPI0027DA7DC0|nr:uncharacterized protein LOC131886245 isoform X2 [Tigriopus californicus]